KGAQQADLAANVSGKVIATYVEKGSRVKQGDVIAKVDTEALPRIAARFDIRSIPTMILFRGGSEAQRLSGAMPAQAIAARLGL
ncbi:MAG TPA: thioredoxin domain-containing protein, partial [Pseudomonadota bacterium]|nr:thioredoxin domain-containing protein [Pseudomonadota bacterium]